MYVCMLSVYIIYSFHIWACLKIGYPKLHGSMEYRPSDRPVDLKL